MDRVEMRKELISVGNYAKKLREQAMFSRKEWAKELKIPLTTIENFENGRVNNAVLLYEYIKLSSEY